MSETLFSNLKSRYYFRANPCFVLKFSSHTLSSSWVRWQTQKPRATDQRDQIGRANKLKHPRFTILICPSDSQFPRQASWTETSVYICFLSIAPFFVFFLLLENESCSSFIPQPPRTRFQRVGLVSWRPSPVWEQHLRLLFGIVFSPCMFDDHGQSGLQAPASRVYYIHMTPFTTTMAALLLCFWMRPPCLPPTVLPYFCLPFLGCKTVWKHVPRSRPDD